MKPSKLTIEYIRDFLRIDPGDDADQIITAELSAMHAAAVQYAESYTGLPLAADEEGERCLDDYEDVTIAILAIIADMYETRSSTLEKRTYKNQTVECILSMHSYNLI